MEKYTIRVNVKDKEAYVVDFEVFQIIFNDGENKYETLNPINGKNETAELNLACKFLSGSIKWDGCSNINVSPDGYDLHFCGKEDVVEFGNLLIKLYDIARDLLPSADWDN